MFLPVNIIKKTFFIFILILLFKIHSLKAENWQPGGTSPSSLITGIHACKTSPVIIVSTLKNGIFKSDDSGKSWMNVSNNNDSLFTLVAFTDQYLLAGGKGKVYKSIDSGSTWTVSSIPHRVAVGKIAFHSASKIIIGTGSVWDFENSEKGNGILLSTDSAKTWVKKNTGFGKDNLLIQSLAVAPDGKIFVGIHDENTGLNDRLGVYYTSNEGESWQRLIMNIDAPYSVKYSDEKLRINNVFNIAIEDGIILAAINGIYSNFGFGFTVKCKVSDVTKENNKWTIHWVEDSLPIIGSSYRQTNSLYKDSQGTYWASISPSVSETSNTIYFDKDLVSRPWNISSSDELFESYGRFMFTEDGVGNLYTASYFGKQIFKRSVHGPLSIPTIFNPNSFSALPVPCTSFLKIKGPFAKSTTIKLVNLIGNEVLSELNLMPGDSEYILNIPVTTPRGSYILQINDGEKRELKQIILE